MELLPAAALPPFHVGTWGFRPFRLGRGGLSHAQLAVSADGGTLWIYEGYKLATLSADDGLTRKTVIPSPNAIFHAVARTADDGLLLVGYGDVLWYDPRADVARGAMKLERGERWSVAASPTDPDRGACVTRFGLPAALLLSRAEGRARSLTLDPRAGVIRDVTFSPDGAAVLVLCTQAVLRFDARTGDALPALLDLAARLPPGAPPLVDLAALVFADAASAVVVDRLGAAVVLDLATGDVRASGVLEAGLHAIAAGPSSGGRLVACRDRSLFLYDLPSLARAGTLTGDVWFAAEGSVVLDPSRPVAWVVDHRGALHRADLRAPSLRTAHAASFPNALAWSGGSLRVARFDSPVETVDLATGASTFLTIEPGASVPGFSADGDGVFVSHNCEVRRVDLRDGAVGPPIREHRPFALAAGGCWGLSKRGLELGERFVPFAPPKHVRALAASPAGRLALVVGGSEGVVVDVDGGVEFARYKLANAFFAEFITEDEAVAGGPGGLRWIDVRTGAVLAHAKRAKGDRGAVSRDGRVAAVVISMEQVMLVTRDRPDDPVGFTCAWHPQRVAFSPDGSRLAVAGAESVVRVFDVEAALATRSPPKKRR